MGETGRVTAYVPPYITFASPWHVLSRFSPRSTYEGKASMPTAPVMQMSMFGNPTPAVSSDVVSRMTYILEQYPEAREDYKAAIFLYWREFEGLGDVLGEKADDFRIWLMDRATPPKTLQNRCQDCQNRRPDLDASKETEKWRRRQAKAGPVR